MYSKEGGCLRVRNGSAVINQRILVLLGGSFLSGLLRRGRLLELTLTLLSIL